MINIWFFIFLDINLVLTIKSRCFINQKLENCFLTKYSQISFIWVAIYMSSTPASHYYYAVISQTWSSRLLTPLPSFYLSCFILAASLLPCATYSIHDHSACTRSHSLVYTTYFLLYVDLLVHISTIGMNCFNYLV